MKGRPERRRYSLPELRSRGQALITERELDDAAMLARRREAQGLGLAEEAPEWREWMDEDEPDLDRPLSFLPEGARVVGFLELAVSLAADARGYALLTGVERGAAGLDEFRCARDSWSASSEAAQAFSFCVNGVTYTAFESSSDDYRSSMRALVAREGNWCECQFEPCALAPEFVEYRDYDEKNQRWSPRDPEAGMSDVLELCVPGSERAALRVGTNRSDEWYPSFVGAHDPLALQAAREMGVALGYELDDELPEAPRAARSGPRI